ncbi:hypothetical protein N1Z12_000703, partial [Klebsiella pneumoniae]
MALYKTGNPVPSSAMPDVWDNNRVQDEILNSEELEVETRTGIMTPTWKGVLKKNEDEIEETRQNLIPLSRQYMTLAAAQADIVNIPVNSTTYVRSPDGSALADEYMNVAGTLTATGRKMPSQTTVDANTSVITGLDLDRVDLSPTSLGTGKYYQITTGTITTNTDTNWSACAPVNVAGFKRLIITGTFLHREKAAPVLFIDENNAVISVETMGLPLTEDNNFTSLAEYQVSIPAKAVSALISTYAEKSVMVYGTNTDFKQSAVAMSAGRVRRRLVNWIKNTYMSATTGELVTNTDDYYTTQLPVSPGDTFILSCKLKGQSSTVRLVGFLDAAGTLVGAFYPGPGSTTVASISNLSFRAPANAVTMIITAYAVDASTVLQQATVFDRSMTDTQMAVDSASSIAKHTSLPYYPGRYWRKMDGALISIDDAPYCAFHPLEVNPGEKYRIKTN